MTSENKGIRQRKSKIASGEGDSKNDAEIQVHSTTETSIIYKILKICFFSLLLYFAYCYYKSPVSSVAIHDMPEPVKHEGKYAVNQDLQRGKRLHEDLWGPESIELDAENNIYTGLKDGRIVMIEKGPDGAIGEGPVNVVLNLKKPSRPLGLRLRGDLLYVADAHQGIYTVNVKTRVKSVIVSLNDTSPSMKFTDDLAITKDGKFMYFTDASSRWYYTNVAFCVFEGTCWGRLFVMNLETGVIKTLIEGLCFANGVQLSADESKLFLCETHRNRLKVIDIKTSKIVKTVIFPGLSDNIRPSRRGGYWVALPSLQSSFIRYTSKIPIIRDITAAIFGETGLYRFAKLNFGAVVELDSEGEVIRSLWDIDGKLAASVTQVTETNDGHLLLGSVFFHGIVKVELN